MSKEFNKACLKIEKEYSMNTILCIEQIFPVVSAVEFDNLDLILVSVKDRNNSDKEIIPSLSIYKEKHSDANSAINYSELWGFIRKHSAIEKKVKENKSLDDLLSYAVSSGFLVQNVFEFRAVILIKHASKDIIKRKCLLRLARVAYYIRQKSQNLLNDSNQLADHNRKELKGLLTSNLDSAVDTITNYIETKYGVNAYALQYFDKTKSWTCKKTCPIDVVNIVKIYIERVSDQVKPIAGIYSGKYFIIFPFISTLIQRDLQSLILFQSDSTIPSYIVTNLRYFTNYYFAVYLEDKKSDLLELLQKKTLGLYQEVENTIDCGNQINLHQQLCAFIEPAFEIAISATNAFSASLRLYDPETGSLEIVHEIGSGRVEKVSPANKTGIPISDYSKSQVAFVFSYSVPGDDGKYIPDIKKIKCKANPAYREHRSNSRSELCFCVHFKKTPIGVLNFESAQLSGFIHDKSFLKK